MQTVDGVVVGPGLGQTEWAHGLWRRLLRTDLPLVVDADGAQPACRRARASAAIGC